MNVDFGEVRSALHSGERLPDGWRDDAVIQRYVVEHLLVNQPMYWALVPGAEMGPSVSAGPLWYEAAERDRVMTWCAGMLALPYVTARSMIHGLHGKIAVELLLHAATHASGVVEAAEVEWWRRIAARWHDELIDLQGAQMADAVRDSYRREFEALVCARALDGSAVGAWEALRLAGMEYDSITPDLMVRYEAQRLEWRERR